MKIIYICVLMNSNENDNKAAYDMIVRNATLIKRWTLTD